MRSKVSVANALFVLVIIFLLQNGLVAAQKKAGKVTLLEDTAGHQWCAYNKESAWQKAVQETGAMTVGTLSFSNDQLSRIDVTETDESGDWTVYDHYRLDHANKIVRLERMINVLPGDRSVVQTFSISEDRAKKIQTESKQLSTGKILNDPKPIWLPQLAIRTELSQFPFSALITLPNLRTWEKSCVQRTRQ